MKKYVIVKTGEEVKYGDTIQLSQSRETSFGVFKRISKFKLSPINAELFIRHGIIKCVEEETASEDTLNRCLEIAAKKMECSVKELVDILERMNRICPKAVLDLLLQTLALKFYNENIKAFNEAKEYFSLKPKDGKVGKVYNNNKYIPLFKSEEDAEKAREVLKKQLTLMYGKS